MCVDYIIIEKQIGKKPDIALIDYFDTVVERTVHPEDVKRIAARKLSELIGNKLEYSEIYAMRAKFERQICQENYVAGYDLEFNFFTLRDQLATALSHRVGISTSLIAQWIVDVEISTECAVQSLVQDTYELLKEFKNRNIPIYLVSDFYLPKELFMEMIYYHSIKEFFSDIFVSADDLLTKKSGRKYAVIKSCLSSPTLKLVMIGDNREADFNRAIEHGIVAFHLNRSHKYDYYAAKTRELINWKLLSDRIKREMQGKDEVFPELALTLFYFTMRLYHGLVVAGYRDVFFLSREGQFLKILFEDFQDMMGCKGSRRIRTHYLAVSRRATFMPSLKSLAHEDFETLFRQYRCISLSEFLESLGLSNFTNSISIALEVPANERYDDFAVSDVFHRLKNNSYFKEKYENRRTEQFDAFCAYLRSFNITEHSSTLAIVDVGWKGTIQDNIYNLLSCGGAEVTGFKKVVGYYIGLVAPGNTSDYNRKISLIFSCVNSKTKGFEIFNENRSLFEVSLGADHGSVKGYSRNACGSGDIVLEDFSIERPLFEEKIRPLQFALRKRFKHITQHLGESVYSSSALHGLVTQLHARMVFGASKNEILWILSIFHVENFGVFELSRFSSSDIRPSFFDRLKFTYRLIKKKSIDELGFWPWLTIKEKGLPLVYRLYAGWRLRKLQKKS